MPETDPVYAAVDLLFKCRHQLPPDVLRSLGSIWGCGLVARYGFPNEELCIDTEELEQHDIAECERENAG
jgi:hypothetical protein